MYETQQTIDITNISPTAGAFNRLYELIKTLRAPGGCPWDREQTPTSMRASLIEEAFELLGAIVEGEPCHIQEELGDLLLNTIMLSYMYEEDNSGQEASFTVASVINVLCDKLIRRHPHVFPLSQGQVVVEKKAATASEVLSQWDKIKATVEGRGGKSILDSVDKGLPPLMKALKYQKKVSKLGFDWSDIAGVEAKIKEEYLELKEAIATKDSVNMEEEAGDYLFAIVNYLKCLGIDASLALSRANDKFYRRFHYIEEQLSQRGQALTKDNLPLMEALWQEAKGKER